MENENNDCTIEEILNNQCLYKEISFEQYEEIYNELFNTLFGIYKGENIIIQTKNVTFQVSLYNEQKTYNDKNISNIDLGECESYLKQK